MFQEKASRPKRVRGKGPVLALLGPAFVAAVAYVDPGNVGANLSAGATYGYALVWVLVTASLMAAVIQYQSAKLGIVAGRSLTGLVAEWLQQRRGSRVWSLAYGLQAFVIAMATDLAEVVGGAVALHLLFGTPLWLGGIIVGVVSIVLLRTLRRRGEKVFEYGVTAMLAMVVFGFLGALYFAPPAWDEALAGLRPQVPDGAAWPLIAAMLGATVMPHAIYLHAQLAIDRHRPAGEPTESLPHLLRVQRIDVGLALAIAGTVNVSMILLAAATLQGVAGDTVEAAYDVFATSLGQVAAVIFALGLLASGVGSAVVGTHAGSQVLKEMMPWRMSALTRRVLTLLPAVAFLLAGVQPTAILVASQTVLSFGIALALVPLALLTRNRRIMGVYADRIPQQVLLFGIAALVIALNVVTIVQTVGG